MSSLLDNVMFNDYINLRAPLVLVGCIFKKIIIILKIFKILKNQKKSQVHYRANRVWDVNADDKVDFIYVTVHELGHYLGMVIQLIINLLLVNYSLFINQLYLYSQYNQLYLYSLKRTGQLSSA